MSDPMPMCNSSNWRWGCASYLLIFLSPTHPLACCTGQHIQSSGDGCMLWRAQGGVPQRSDRQLVTGAAPRIPGQEGRYSKEATWGWGFPESICCVQRIWNCHLQTWDPAAASPHPRRLLGAPSPSNVWGENCALTFMRSYLSSTSWSQEMNWRALKRSLTDLFSSPWRNQIWVFDRGIMEKANLQGVSNPPS